jgi:hypothetical protein
MTEQEPVGGDERVARLIQAARELIDAYQRKSTANEHFLKLESAVDALDGGNPQPRDAHDPATRRSQGRPTGDGRLPVGGAVSRSSRSGSPSAPS